MYAVVRKWKSDPARTQEAVRKIQQTFVPEVRGVEGFVAYYTVQGEGENVFTISICQDREGIEETTRRSKAFVDRELKGIIRGPPEVLTGEVLVEAHGAGEQARRERPERRG